MAGPSLVLRAMARLAAPGRSAIEANQSRTCLTAMASTVMRGGFPPVHAMADTDGKWINDAWGVRTKRRRASAIRFLFPQAAGRCRPFRIRQLARAALERQRPPRTCGNSSRTAARLPSVTIGSTRYQCNARTGGEAAAASLYRQYGQGPGASRSTPSETSSSALAPVPAAVTWTVRTPMSVAVLQPRCGCGTDHH
jgi:hypothetical protein